MAAELEDEALHGVGGLAVEEAPDLGRAGEGEDADARVLGPGGDDRRRVAGDDVEDAGREAGPLGELGQREGGERGLGATGGSTTVQPAASAAAALRVIIAAGKFQGVTSAATPAGSRQSSTSASCRCEVTPSMFGRRASSA